MIFLRLAKSFLLLTLLVVPKEEDFLFSLTSCVLFIGDGIISVPQSKEYYYLTLYFFLTQSSKSKN
jgi:hypothetical protein